MTRLLLFAEILGAIAAIGGAAWGVISLIRFLSGLIDKLKSAEKNILDLKKDLRRQQAQTLALERKFDERMDGVDRRIYNLFGRSKFTIPPKD